MCTATADPHGCGSLYPASRAAVTAITFWDTRRGHAVDTAELDHRGGMLVFQPPDIAADLAIAIRRIG